MQQELVAIYRQIQAGDKQAAFMRLRELVHQHPQDERIWFLLSLAVSRPEEQRYCLERVLKLEPQNKLARERLQALMHAQSAAREAARAAQRRAQPTSVRQTQPQVAITDEQRVARPADLPHTGALPSIAPQPIVPQVVSAPKPAETVKPIEVAPVVEADDAVGSFKERRAEHKLRSGFRRQLWLMLGLLAVLGGALVYLWWAGELHQRFPAQAWLNPPARASALPTATPSLPSPTVAPPAFTATVPAPTETPTLSRATATATVTLIGDSTAAVVLESSTPLGVNTVSTPAELPATAPASSMALAGAPNGWLSFVRIAGETQQLFALTAPERLDYLERPLYRMELSPGELASSPVWSPDGTKIAWSAVTDGQADIWIANADGSGAYNLTAAGGNDTQPSWAPDGTQLAFISDRDGNPHVYQVRVSGRGLVQLTKGNSVDESPSWSPKGIDILFASNRNNGQWDIYAVTAGSSGVRTLTNDAWEDRSPAYSPNGQLICFISNRGGNPDVFLMGVDGKNLFNLSESNGIEQSPAWSPDGLWIVYSSTRDAHPSADLYMQGATDATVTRLTFDDNAAELMPSWQKK